MVCPCRVILAALSAFVAVFLVWRTTRDKSQRTEQSSTEQRDAAKVSLNCSYLSCNTWLGKPVDNLTANVAG